MNRQSRICRQCYAAEAARPASYLTNPCAKCAKPFTRHKSQAERGQGRYCGLACARSGSPTRKKLRPVLTCASCRASFEKFRSELAKTSGANSFCSPACWYKYNQRENNQGWNGGQRDRATPGLKAWRNAVLARDKNLCRLCHDIEPLEVHHILPFGAFPEMRTVVANGITLCRPCHVSLRYRELEHFPWLTAIAGVPLVIHEVAA